MIAQDKISKFIGLLIEDTRAGACIWEKSSERNPDSLEGEQSVIGLIYKSTYHSKQLRLYKYNEPVQVDEFEFRTKYYIKLDFVDGRTNLYSFPHYIRELHDLYETVQIKTSGLDSFIDSLIPDKDPTDF